MESYIFVLKSRKLKGGVFPLRHFAITGLGVIVPLIFHFSGSVNKFL